MDTAILETFVDPSLFVGISDAVGHFHYLLLSPAMFQSVVLWESKVEWSDSALRSWCLRASGSEDLCVFHRGYDGSLR